MQTVQSVRDTCSHPTTSHAVLHFAAQILNISPHLSSIFPASGIQIKEEPDSEEWQLSGDSTLNPSDLNNLRVQMGDEDLETPSGEGKRLRRVACTCPNCKESGGRWASGNNTKRITYQKTPGGDEVLRTEEKKHDLE